jgi:hypothetical protein
MREAEKHAIGTVEGLGLILQSVQELRVILVHANAQLIKNDIDKYHLPSLLIDAVRQSTEAFEVLVAHELFRDAFPTARTIFETALNAVYILSPGSDAEEKAVKHAKQKSHRHITTTYEFKTQPSIGWPKSLVFDPPQDYKEALREYTSKKGREVTSWTPETINSRIDSVEKWLGTRLGDGLRFQYESIYPLASEFAHGTFYSVMFWLGAYNLAGDAKSEEFVRYHRVSETAVTAIHVTGTLQVAIKAICKTIGNDTLDRKAKKTFTELSGRLGLDDSNKRT